MSPLKKPSSVDAITRAAAAPKGDPVLHDLNVADEHERTAKPAPVKPVRVTLNIPPDLYRDFRRWAERQAENLDLPKLDDQKALRGLIRGVIGSPEITAAVLHRGLYNEVRGRE